MSRVSKLFLDWLSVQKSEKINEASILLQAGLKKSTYYDSLIESMGVDGKKLDVLFKESKDTYGKDGTSAKKALAEELVHEMGGGKVQNTKDGVMMTTIGTSYFPTMDRANTIESISDENERDVLLQIRNAVAGGNMEIAGELLKNAWGGLSLKERNGLVEWVNAIGKYNTNGHMSRPSIIKPLEKVGDVKKEDFISKFIMTAKENMKIS